MLGPRIVSPRKRSRTLRSENRHELHLQSHRDDDISMIVHMKMHGRCRRSWSRKRNFHNLDDDGGLHLFHANRVSGLVADGLTRFFSLHDPMFYNNLTARLTWGSSSRPHYRPLLRSLYRASFCPVPLDIRNGKRPQTVTWRDINNHIPRVVRERPGRVPSRVMKWLQIFAAKLESHKHRTTFHFECKCLRPYNVLGEGNQVASTRMQPVCKRSRRATILPDTWGWKHHRARHTLERLIRSNQAEIIPGTVLRCVERKRMKHKSPVHVTFTHFKRCHNTTTHQTIEAPYECIFHSSNAQTYPMTRNKVASTYLRYVFQSKDDHVTPISLRMLRFF